MSARAPTFHPSSILDAQDPDLGARVPYLSMKRAVQVLAAGLLVVAVAWDFATATTFLGDDYLFRAFAWLEANPFLAFVDDKHGGEYYRPLPMLIWWLLERISGGQVWVFALVAFLQHALCAVLLAVVGRKTGFAARTAVLAGCLFFAAPAEREAAHGGQRAWRCWGRPFASSRTGAGCARFRLRWVPWPSSARKARWCCPRCLPVLAGSALRARAIRALDVSINGPV